MLFQYDCSFFCMFQCILPVAILHNNSTKQLFLSMFSKHFYTSSETKAHSSAECRFVRVCWCILYCNFNTIALFIACHPDIYTSSSLPIYNTNDLYWVLISFVVDIKLNIGYERGGGEECCQFRFCLEKIKVCLSLFSTLSYFY